MTSTMMLLFSLWIALLGHYRVMILRWSVVYGVEDKMKWEGQTFHSFYILIISILILRIYLRFAVRGVNTPCTLTRREGEDFKVQTLADNDQQCQYWGSVSSSPSLTLISNEKLRDYFHLYRQTAEDDKGRQREDKVTMKIRRRWLQERFVCHAHNGPISKSRSVRALQATAAIDY